MGKNKGSLAQNVGYDNYHGFLSVSDEYTEWRDVYFNPEVALSPAFCEAFFDSSTRQPVARGSGRR